MYTVSRKKRPQFSLYNFNKCRHSFEILAQTILRTYFTEKIKKNVRNIIISLRNDGVIVTSFKTTLSCTASGKDTTIFCL